MGIQLRVLIVEDQDDETLMLLRVLRCAGYDLTFDQVDTANALEAALDQQTWDIIIADYTLPKLNGLTALALVKERGLDLPFIILSGRSGEDIAVAAMKAGAHNYIMKSNLARLSRAVERELREAEVRRARQRAEATLQENSDILHAVFEGASDAIFVKDLQGRYVMINTVGAQILSKSPEDVIGKDDAELFTAESVGQILEHDRQVLASGATRNYEETITVLGTTRILLSTKAPHRDHRGHIIGIIGIARDITERNQAEEQFQPQRDGLSQREQLATMRQLLVEVAHELNNPLSVVVGQAALLRQSLRNKCQMERVEKIVQSAERCARIVNNFLALAWQPPPERHPVLMNQLAQEAVELAVEDAEETAVTVVPEVPVALRGGRVLVVDDEPGIAGILAEVLQLDGHVVETVGNGKAALGKLALGGYELILSDIRMPELDGPSLYRELERRDPRLLRRMIFLTGDTLSPGTREFLKNTGAPCLSKPFALSDVREIVQRVLQSQEHEGGGQHP